MNATETPMLGFLIYGAAIVMAPRLPRCGGALLVHQEEVMGFNPILNTAA